jgi:TorA maturation chaperone TorD
VGRLAAAFAEGDLQDLLVDYTRLFLGPVQPLARPYGSFWLEGETTLMQASSVDVLEAVPPGRLRDRRRLS